MNGDKKKCRGIKAPSRVGMPWYVIVCFIHYLLSVTLTEVLQHHLMVV